MILKPEGKNLSNIILFIWWILFWLLIHFLLVESVKMNSWIDCYSSLVKCFWGRYDLFSDDYTYWGNRITILAWIAMILFRVVWSDCHTKKKLEKKET